MTVAEHWTAPTYGLGGDVVLCVDFEATGRTEASFLDLATRLEPERELWCTKQPPAWADADMTASDYVTCWADGFLASGRTVGAVLGFCAGGVFGAALAEQIGRQQGGMPDVVILDPELPTVATLATQFSNAMRGVADFVSPEESLRMTCAATEAEKLEDPATVAEVLTRAYGDLAGAAFSRLGLKPGYRDYLIASFASLMSYLVAAGQIEAGEGWKRATAILSTAPPNMVEGVANVIRLDVGHTDLLRSTDTALVVSALLDHRARTLEGMITDA